MKGASSRSGKSDGSSGTVVGGGGDSGGGNDGISEGVESKRPDLMIARDDNSLNRTGSVDFNDGCDDGGDGGGNVSEDADLTIALDDGSRVERGDATHEEKDDGEVLSSTTAESRLSRLRRLTSTDGL
jgi:hypothetical protein